jgi:hypothetical protein
MMNALLITGSCLVFLALASYSTAFFSLMKRLCVTDRIRLFYSLGVGLDVSATAFMISGSHNFPLTFHGLLGYSALGMMLTDMILLRRFRKKKGARAKIPTTLHHFSILAYVWWIAAFVAGAIIASRLHN